MQGHGEVDRAPRGIDLDITGVKIAGLSRFNRALVV